MEKQIIKIFLIVFSLALLSGLFFKSVFIGLMVFGCLLFFFYMFLHDREYLIKYYKENLKLVKEYNVEVEEEENVFRLYKKEKKDLLVIEWFLGSVGLSICVLSYLYKFTNWSFLTSILTSLGTYMYTYACQFEVEKKIMKYISTLRFIGMFLIVSCICYNFDCNFVTIMLYSLGFGVLAYVLPIKT